MRCLLSAALVCAALTVPGLSQNAGVGRELESILTFETMHNGTAPSGWGGGPPKTIFVDSDIVHSGSWAARLERSASAEQSFSTLTGSIPIEFSGTTIEWRGFLRIENVREYMGLWMRQDGDTPNLAFATMQPRRINGTHDWTEYSITFPLHQDARLLYFGVLLAGTGKVWADDLRLLVDGKPVWEAPRVERPKTPIELDHQFDAGSGIVVSELSTLQIENLVALGKVWGFVKYHHPAVTAGTRHWDYELFRVLPAVLSARTREAADRAMLDWIRPLDSPPVCDRCAPLNDDEVHLRPNFGWMGTAIHPTSRTRFVPFTAAVRRVVSSTYRKSRISATRSSIASLPTPRSPSPTPGINCWDCIDSGTSSSTGSRIGISSTRSGTESSPSSASASFIRTSGRRSALASCLTWRCVRRSPESGRAGTKCWKKGCDRSSDEAGRSDREDGQACALKTARDETGISHLPSCTDCVLFAETACKGDSPLCTKCTTRGDRRSPACGRQ